MIPPMCAQNLATSRRVAVSDLETVETEWVRVEIAKVVRAPNPLMTTCDLVPYPTSQTGCGCPTATPTLPPGSTARRWQGLANACTCLTYVMARQTPYLLWGTAQVNQKGSIPCTSNSHLSRSRLFSGWRLAATRSENRRCSVERPESARQPSRVATSRLALLSARAPVLRPARPDWSTAAARAQSNFPNRTANRGRLANAGRPFCMPSLSLTRPPCSTRS
jgi:hypothetical protein